MTKNVSSNFPIDGDSFPAYRLHTRFAVRFCKNADHVFKVPAGPISSIRSSQHVIKAWRCVSSRGLSSNINDTYMPGSLLLDASESQICQQPSCFGLKTQALPSITSCPERSLLQPWCTPSGVAPMRLCFIHRSRLMLQLRPALSTSPSFPKGS